MSVPFFADLYLDGGLPRARLTRSLVRAAVFAGGTALFLAAALIWSRRLAGAVSTPLAPPALFAVGFSVAATALAARYAWRRTDSTRSASRIVSLWFTVIVVVFALATSLPGSAPIGLLGLWLVVLGEEAWSWLPKRMLNSLQDGADFPRPDRQVPAAKGRFRFEEAITDSSLGVEVTHDQVVQQVTRLVEPDGTERVLGWMRVTFQPGQRLASVHLAFCPPFMRSPEAALERLEGPQVRIKRVQVFPYGARFDLKLGEPAEQTTKVLLQVAAEAAGADEN